MIYVNLDCFIERFRVVRSFSLSAWTDLHIKAVYLTILTANWQKKALSSNN